MPSLGWRSEPLYDRSCPLGRAMPEIELIVVALISAVLGGGTGIVLGRERLGILIWAVAGAVVVSGVYSLRFFR